MYRQNVHLDGTVWIVYSGVQYTVVKAISVITRLDIVRMDVFMESMVNIVTRPVLDTVNTTLHVTRTLGYVMVVLTDGRVIIVMKVLLFLKKVSKINILKMILSFNFILSY